MGEATLQVTGVTRREAWIALLYIALYLGYLTMTLESGLSHWVTLVVLPLSLVRMVRPPDTRGVVPARASFGLRPAAGSRVGVACGK